MTTADDAADRRVLAHEKECREGTGPIAEIRRDLGSLKTWVKAIGLAMVLLEAIHTSSAVAKVFQAAATPTAHAAEK